MIMSLFTLCEVLSGVLMAGLAIAFFMAGLAAFCAALGAALLDDHYRERRG